MNILVYVSLSERIMLDLLKVVTNLDLLMVSEASTSSMTFGITGQSLETPTLGSTLMDQDTY